MMRTHKRGTVRRFQDALVALCRYALDRQLIAVNIAQASAVPRGTGTELMRVKPLNAIKLSSLISHAREINAGYANVIEFASLTGLRWGELAELRVHDVVARPLPSVRVSRSKSDGYAVGQTKSRRERALLT
jgi:integrase